MTSISILAIVLMSASAGKLCGSFKRRPEAEIIETRYNDQFLRRLNYEGVIEVRSAKTLGLIWKIEVEDFSRLFSEYYLALDGQCIVRIRGNHEVNSLDETCVSFYFRDGEVRNIKAEEIVVELTEIVSPFSNTPKFMWYQKIENVWDQKILFNDGQKISRSVTISRAKQNPKNAEQIVPPKSDRDGG